MIFQTNLLSMLSCVIFIILLMNSTRYWWLMILGMKKDFLLKKNVIFKNENLWQQKQWCHVAKCAIEFALKLMNCVRLTNSGPWSTIFIMNRKPERVSWKLDVFYCQRKKESDTQTRFTLCWFVGYLRVHIDYAI